MSPKVGEIIHMKNNWHRHLGIYGICVVNSKLLVVHKNNGPYVNRYDLPGGGLEPGETMIAAMVREFLEETGIHIAVKQNIAAKDFVVPWVREDFEHTHLHHIAILYEVNYLSGLVEDSPNYDDSSGAEWVDISRITKDNSSPLVLEASIWLQNRQIQHDTIVFDEWEIKKLYQSL
jgi:ADP-ribose pyrophosphatase YjhB (NUDIX family)